MTEAAAQPEKKRLRIVLLDDEWHMLLLLEMYLKEWFDGVELLRFQNGDRAWEELSRTPADLLVTDWRHPGLDGGELVKKMAENKISTPVLLLSAADSDCIREISSLGVKVVFLQKPFGVRDFWKVINELAGPCDRPPRLPNFV
jgi:DNA-binding response OmpR family regulator